MENTNDEGLKKYEISLEEDAKELVYQALANYGLNDDLIKKVMKVMNERTITGVLNDLVQVQILLNKSWSLKVKHIPANKKDDQKILIELFRPDSKIAFSTTLTYSDEYDTVHQSI